MYPFNVRVYGLLMNSNNEVLLSDEQEYGMRFTKFPGGGVEEGEGLLEALKREFVEECAAKIDVVSHYYTTDFFVKSAFNNSQIISVYYRVVNTEPLALSFKTVRFDFDDGVEPLQAFRWVKISELNPDDFIFPTDKHVVQFLIAGI